MEKEKKKSQEKEKKYSGKKTQIEINPELKETAILAFGRFNPITIGHEKLAEAMLNLSEESEADPLLYLSHTQDSDKNPLDYNIKLELAQHAFGDMVQESECKTIISILKEVSEKYKNLIYVCGSDRIEQFEELIQKYNDIEYTFENISVVSSGDRNDEDEVSSASGTKMREFVRSDNYDQFEENLPESLKEFSGDIIEAIKESYIIDEALTLAQRNKRARTMKRFSRKIAAARKRKKNRRAPKEVLHKRARRQAIDHVRTKVTGNKDKNYEDLSAGEKSMIDKKVAKRKSQVDRIAKKMLPKVRRAEANRRKKLEEQFEFIMEGTAFSGDVYHGSGYRFSKFSQGKARIFNDFYGGGVAYFTDNQKVAITYAKSMAKKAKAEDPLVYTCKIKLKKVFDVDSVFSGKDLIEILPKDVKEFARGAGLLTLKSNEYEVIAKLESGKMSLTGDKVFAGLSKGMNQTAKARQYLISKGYDGLRYNGGVNMGMATKHNVYLVYNAQDITITKRQIVKKKEKKLAEASQADTKPKKRWHEVYSKDGKVKADRRFRFNKKIAESSDEISRIKDENKREKNRMRASHERELDRAKVRNIRRNVSRQNKLREDLELVKSIYADYELFSEGYLTESQMLSKAVKAMHKYVSNGTPVSDIANEIIRLTGMNVSIRDLEKAYHETYPTKTVVRDSSKLKRKYGFKTEEGGAGEEGTDKLKKRYIKDTPFQKEKDINELYNERFTSQT